MLVYADGRIVGTIGGGATRTTRRQGPASDRDRQAAARQVRPQRRLRPGIVLICGGPDGVYIDPIAAAPAHYIVGRARRLAPNRQSRPEAGFRIHVVDDRENFANAERFPKAETIEVRHRAWLQPRRSPRTAYAVVVTRPHPRFRSHPRARARDLRYLGLIGSRAKIARIFDRRGGRHARRASAVHAPIGLNIARSPPRKSPSSSSRN
jgi:xanthine dehydrogenase accessory factor